MAKLQNINAEIENAFLNEIDAAERAEEKAKELKRILRVAAVEYVRKQYNLDATFRRIGDVKNEYPKVSIYQIFYEKSNAFTLRVHFADPSKGENAHLHADYLQDFLTKYEPIN
jgi:hypothetical protein